MARLNVKATGPDVRTHEGGQAEAYLTAEQQLRRSVMSCLLWENEFYEDGQAIADRIATLARQVPAPTLAALAREARQVFNLRHVPLLLLSVLTETGKGTSIVADTIADVIQRADELPEFFAVHAKRQGVGPDKLKDVMTHGMRKGVRRAFAKFDAYQLAKYDRDSVVRLRDVGLITHVPAGGAERGRLYANLVNREFFPERTKHGNFPVKAAYSLEGTPGLETPDTWEVALSAGEDKKATFERLIRDGKLGYLALLRNLRNMIQAGCDADLVETAIRTRKGAHRVLPFRYIAAARHAPAYAEALNDALLASIDDLQKFSGTTVVLVDVSDSMNAKLSAKSDMTRMDVAAALAVIWPGRKRVFTFSERLVECFAWKGLPGVDSIRQSQRHSGTYLANAIKALNEQCEYDRLVVITDEQSHDGIARAREGAKAYCLNVASAKNGVGYPSKGFVHMDGWSENVIRYLQAVEA